MDRSTSVGYLIGAFDMFNIAHLSVLHQVREICDVLVIGVLSDDEVCRETGFAPITAEQDRGELLRHVRGVDEVVRHDPSWVRDHPMARVYAFGERSDVRTDVVVAPDSLPSNSLLWPDASPVSESDSPGTR